MKATDAADAPKTESFKLAPVKVRLLIAHSRRVGPQSFTLKGRPEKLPTRSDPYLPQLFTREIQSSALWLQVAQQLATGPNHAGFFAFAHLVRTDVPAGPEARVYLDPQEIYSRLESGPDVPALNWQERVIAERDELSQRLSKLEAFVQTEKFSALPDVQQRLMISQRDAMQEYELALNERIALFEPLSAPSAETVGEPALEEGGGRTPGEQTLAAGAESSEEEKLEVLSGEDAAGGDEDVAASDGDTEVGSLEVGETAAPETASGVVDAPAGEADKSVRAPKKSHKKKGK